MSEMIERMAAASYEVGLRPGAYRDLDEPGKAMMRKRMVAVMGAVVPAQQSQEPEDYSSFNVPNDLFDDLTFIAVHGEALK